jgi:hypothetical protein
MGMNWILSTSAANGHTIVAHEGGTGGYSSFVAFDRAAKRGVVLLSDTALTSVGGLGTLGRHLLDPSMPAGAPRVVATADARLIDALVGAYRLTSSEYRRNRSNCAARHIGGFDIGLGCSHRANVHCLPGGKVPWLVGWMDLWKRHSRRLRRATCSSHPIRGCLHGRTIIW